jgi:hypothetical protein
MTDIKNFPPEVERDEVDDGVGSYTRVWHCPPPPHGGKFTVTEDYWDVDAPTTGKPVRHILAFTCGPVL